MLQEKNIVHIHQVCEFNVNLLFAHHPFELIIVDHKGNSRILYSFTLDAFEIKSVVHYKYNVNSVHVIIGGTFGILSFLVAFQPDSYIKNEIDKYEAFEIKMLTKNPCFDILLQYPALITWQNDTSIDRRNIRNQEEQMREAKLQKGKQNNMSGIHLYRNYSLEADELKAFADKKETSIIEIFLVATNESLFTIRNLHPEYQWTRVGRPTEWNQYSIRNECQNKGGIRSICLHNQTESFFSAGIKTIMKHDVTTHEKGVLSNIVFKFKNYVRIFKMKHVENRKILCVHDSYVSILDLKNNSISHQLTWHPIITDNTLPMFGNVQISVFQKEIYISGRSPVGDDSFKGVIKKLTWENKDVYLDTIVDSKSDILSYLPEKNGFWISRQSTVSSFSFVPCPTKSFQKTQELMHVLELWNEGTIQLDIFSELELIHLFDMSENMQITQELIRSIGINSKEKVLHMLKSKLY